jgi:hypothetical protein
MDQLEELFKQMQELAGVGLDMLQGARGAAADKGGAPAHEGGAPAHENGAPPKPEGGGGAPEKGAPKPPPFGH